MKSIIVILCIFGSMASCGSDKNHTVNVNPSATSISGGAVSIIYKDSKGNDLLDSATHGYYKRENIKLYHLIDGKKIRYKGSVPSNMWVEPNSEQEFSFKNGFSISGKGMYTHGFRVIGFITGPPDILYGPFNKYTTGYSTAFLELDKYTIDTIKEQWAGYPSIRSDENRGIGGGGSSTIRVWYNGVLSYSASQKLPGMIENTNCFIIIKDK